MRNLEAILRVENIHAGYQGYDILKGISFQVDSEEIVCVIGPNGAGKSTIFNALYGLIRIRSGHIWFDGQEVTGFRPQEMLYTGISMVAQWRSLFPQMTVYENLELGMYTSRDKKRVKRRIEDLFSRFPILENRASQKAGTLSGGEQRMLEIGRALLLRPKLLLIDEPSAGLAPLATDNIYGKLTSMNRDYGLTILMIEQNARRGLEISDRGYVLDLGRIIYEGSARDLITDPEVRRLFLGGASQSHIKRESHVS